MIGCCNQSALFQSRVVNQFYTYVIGKVIAVGKARVF